MAGLVTVELDDVLDGLDLMVRQGRDLRPVWRAVRGGLRQDLKEHFDRRESPEGRWTPPAPATIERVLSKGGRRKNVTRRGTLKRGAARRLANQLGRLKTWWIVQYNQRAISATSGAEWSAIHQEGGTAAHGARIPRRTFAWVTDAFVGAVADVVAEHVVKVF